MTFPQFSPHLPAGPLLDWVFSKQGASGDHTQYTSPIGFETVKATWDRLDDVTIIQVINGSVDGDLLEWVAQTGNKRNGVRNAVLRNSATPLNVVRHLLMEEITPGDRDAVAASRTETDLCTLLLERFDIATSAQQAATWIGQGLRQQQNSKTCRDAIQLTEESMRPLLLAAMLKGDPAKCTFPLATAVDAIESLPEGSISEDVWRRLAAHVALHEKDMGLQVLGMTKSTLLRVGLLVEKTVTFEQAFHKLDLLSQVTVLHQLPETRVITVDEMHYLNQLNLDTNTYHGLHCTPEAALWGAQEGIPAMAGAVVWQTKSDQQLVTVLRNIPDSYRWVTAHLWRLAEVWPRLSNRVRTKVTTQLDAIALCNLVDGPIRDWIVESGPVETIAGLTLRRHDIKKLIERAEHADMPEIAWLAAHNAERPRERANMAALGMKSEHWEKELRRWLRAAQTGEIVRLWNLTDETQKEQVGQILVDSIHPSSEASWVDRLLEEISIDWQSAPTPVQEAVALWLAGHVRENVEMWETICILYPEWVGTLPGLVHAATKI